MENTVKQKGNSRLTQWLLFLSFLLPVAIWIVIFIITGNNDLLWLLISLALPAAFLSGKPSVGVGLTLALWLIRFYDQARGFGVNLAINYAMLMPLFVVLALYLACEFIMKKLPETKGFAEKLQPVLKTVTVILIGVVIIGAFVFWAIEWGRWYPSLAFLSTVAILTAYALLYSGLLDKKAGIRKILAWVILIALAAMLVFALVDMIVRFAQGRFWRTVITEFFQIAFLFFLNVPAFFYVFFNLEYDASSSLKAKVDALPKMTLSVPEPAVAEEPAEEAAEEVAEEAAE